MLFAIQFLYDLFKCVDYETVTEKNALANKIKAKMVAKCMVYKYNEEKLMKLEMNTKEFLELKSNVSKATDQLKKWH